MFSYVIPKWIQFCIVFKESSLKSLRTLPPCPPRTRPGTREDPDEPMAPDKQDSVDATNHDCTCEHQITMKRKTKTGFHGHTK